MIDCFIKQSSFSISNCMESHTVKIPIVDLFPNRQGVIDGKGFNRFITPILGPIRRSVSNLNLENKTTSILSYCKPIARRNTR